MTVYIVAIAGLIMFSAFFSAAEISYSAANLVRLENAMEGGSRRARAAVFIEEHYDDALSTILIGNNLVNIAMSSIASVAAIMIAGEEWTWLATIIVTLLVIVFGETMPKIIAKKNANRLALSLSYIVRGLMIITKPVVLIVVGLVRLITLPMRGEEQEDGGSDAAVEELQSIIETAEDEAVLDEDRSELLQAALDFSEISASEAMTARVDMVAIDIDDDIGDILDIIDGTPFSRLPVYEDGIDNIIGFLYLNHFLKAMVDREKPDIRSLLMPPLYVYKTIKLPQVLAELRKAKKHLAIVTDEYGGTLGVISMEDVLEQIVGDIWDETDEVEDEVVRRENGEYELDGDMSISDFLDLLDIAEDAFAFESETVGGWTLEMFGGFPEEGYGFIFGDLKVTVLKMDGLRVEKVLVKKEPEKE
ncbi:MAG: HlyC/CorC family transporter [Clostridia bacterium]|nr:HlyC/CorC family transporter [Clostridia bacterium]